MIDDIVVTTPSNTAPGKHMLMVASPYNEDFVAGARELAGTFARETGQWLFDPRDEARVRALLMRVYGDDGTPVPARVTLHVDLGRFFGTEYDHVTVAGRRVAERRARDSSVKLTGAVVVAGRFPGRGGSVKNPALNFDPGTVLEVRDVPAGHADVTGQGVTVVDTTVDEQAVATRDRVEIVGIVGQPYYVRDLLVPGHTRKVALVVHLDGQTDPAVLVMSDAVTEALAQALMFGGEPS